jgi:hypothetical protein
VLGGQPGWVVHSGGNRHPASETALPFNSPYSRYPLSTEPNPLDAATGSVASWVANAS